MSDSSISSTERETAPTVCEPCKRRKKSCDKALPGCSRCVRLMVKCCYSTENSNLNSNYQVVQRRPGNDSTTLPPLVEVVPGFIYSSSSPTSLPNSLIGGKGWGMSIDDQVKTQVFRLLAAVSRKRGYLHDHCEIYFRTYGEGVPVVDEEGFWERLRHGESGEREQMDSHFGSLMLGMFLISCLTPRPFTSPGDGEELYLTLKSIFSLLQSTGKVTLELVQLGILIASWEHCQALHQDSWLTIGCCVRMAQILGLHSCVRQLPPENNGDGKKRRAFEERRNVWWCVVVIERVINQEYMDSKLPFSSTGPTPDDYLPRVPLKDGIKYKVKDEILLPDDIDLSNIDIASRGFTRFGSFAATIQMTYLSDLTTQHILDESKSPKEKRDDATRLDIALQHFSGACIPPPGKAQGHYCGPYGLRTSAAFSLHLHELDISTRSNDPQGVSRAIFAIQSLTRIIIYACRMSVTGVPLDYDGITFWSHRITALTALMHIQFGDQRDAEWEENLMVLKRHLNYYAPRFRLYANYLKEIEAAETSIIIS